MSSRAVFPRNSFFQACYFFVSDYKTEANSLLPAPPRRWGGGGGIPFLESHGKESSPPPPSSLPSPMLTPPCIRDPSHWLGELQRVTESYRNLNLTLRPIFFFFFF